MIKIFCDRRGTGKTKALIDLANEKVLTANGDIVYIDDDDRPSLELSRKIRFVNAKEFNFTDQKSFYGILCGIISQNYDIQTIFIDGLFNIVEEDVQGAVNLLNDMEKLAQKFNIEFYINVNGEAEKVPPFMRKYIA